MAVTRARARGPTARALLVTKTNSQNQYADVIDVRTIAVICIVIGFGVLLVIESPRPTPEAPSVWPVAHVEPWELGGTLLDASLADGPQTAPDR